MLHVFGWKKVFIALHSCVVLLKALVLGCRIPGIVFVSLKLYYDVTGLLVGRGQKPNFAGLQSFPAKQSHLTFLLE